jgi:hypothetical protein
VVLTAALTVVRTVVLTVVLVVARIVARIVTQVRARPTPQAGFGRAESRPYLARQRPAAVLTLM